MSEINNINNHLIPESQSDKLLGLIFLIPSLFTSVIAQFILKNSMNEIGSVGSATHLTQYFEQMINFHIISGFLLYFSGTILWLLSLRKLELSFAYPMQAVKYFLVFIGAWYLFGEHINMVRILGLCVILIGIIIISFDHEKISEESE